MTLPRITRILTALALCAVTLTTPHAAEAAATSSTQPSSTITARQRAVISRYLKHTAGTTIQVRYASKMCGTKTRLCATTSYGYNANARYLTAITVRVDRDVARYFTSRTSTTLSRSATYLLTHESAHAVQALALRDRFGTAAARTAWMRSYGYTGNCSHMLEILADAMAYAKLPHLAKTYDLGTKKPSTRQRTAAAELWRVTKVHSDRLPS